MKGESQFVWREPIVEWVMSTTVDLGCTLERISKTWVQLGG